MSLESSLNSEDRILFDSIHSQYDEILSEQENRLERLGNRLAISLTKKSQISAKGYNLSTIYELNDDSNKIESGAKIGDENESFKYEKNSLYAYVYEENNRKIAACLKEAVYLFLSRVLIEYLTFNFNSFMKNEMRKSFLREIRHHLAASGSSSFGPISFKHVEQNLKIFEFNVKNKMSNRHFIHSLVTDLSDILLNEVENLKKSVLHEYEKMLLKTFLKPSKYIRFKMKNLADNEPINSKYLPLMTDQTEEAQSNELENDPNKQNKNYFLKCFGRFTLFRLYFPSLVYKSDLLNTNHMSKFKKNLIKDGTKLNNYVKSLTGLFFAFLLTYLIYTYFRYEVKLEESHAFASLVAVFLVLSIGLGHKNARFRCITLLVIPFMASSRGRTFLVMNCVNLSSSHILSNLFKNVEVFVYFFSCSKQTIANELKHLASDNDATRWHKNKLNKLKELSHKMQRQASLIKNVAQKTGSYVKKGYQGVKRATQICDNAFSDQQQTCYRKYNDSTTFQKFAAWIIDVDCEKFYGVKSPCDSVKETFRDMSYEIVEHFDEYLNDTFSPLINQFKFHLKTKKRSSKTGLGDRSTKILNEIADDILNIYYKRIESLTFYLGKVKLLFPVSLILVILKAIKYHNKYLKSDYFQNYVLGIKFYELDEKRRSKSQASLLPLNEFLKYKFVGLFDSYLTQKEIDLTLKSLSFLAIILTPIYAAMLSDYLMYKLNFYLHENARIDIKINHTISSSLNKSIISVEENGGFMSNFYSKLVSIMDKDRKNKNIRPYFSNEKCLPDASAPNYSIYKRIFSYTIIVLILTLFQSYIKRWRSAFAGFVYPDRDLERSVWLYNHLLAINRSLGLEKSNNKSLSDTLLKKLINFTLKTLYLLLNFAYTMFMIFSCYYFCLFVPRLSLKTIYLKLKTRILVFKLRFKTTYQNYCIICGARSEIEKVFDDDDSFVKCANELCKGFYCLECFSDLNNTCKLCRLEIMHESGHESLEKDSSDEDSKKEEIYSDSLSDEESQDSIEFGSDKNEKRVNLVLEEISNDSNDSEFDYFRRKNTLLSNKKRQIRFLDKDLDFSYQKARRTLEEVLNEEKSDSNFDLQIDDASNSSLNEHSWRKFDTELLDYDLNRTHKLIESSLFIFYKNIHSLIGHEQFRLIIKTSKEIKQIFDAKHSDYNLFDDLTEQIIRNYIEIFKWNDFFDLDEAKKASFYEYLQSFDEL